MSDRRPFVHDMKNYLGIIIGYSNLMLEELAPEDPRRTDINEILQAGESAIALLDQWSAAAPGPEQK
jgi:signal transduction histidine kinase